MNAILFYEGPWYFFSNFSSFVVYWEGACWMTSEHAYQAAKFDDETIRHMIRDARSAHDAKKIARAHSDKVRGNWASIKLSIMEDILRAKLKQHLYIRRRLVESGDAELIEDSSKDPFWGRGPDWEGENHLGKLWMKLRKELRNIKSFPLLN